MKTLFKTIIFDMDGTLLDSERSLLDLWESVALKKGYVFSREIMESTVGVTFEDTMRIITEAYPDAPHDEIRKETSARFNEMRANGEIGLQPGVREALEYVSGLGLRIGLCTSTRRSSAIDRLKSAGILDYFDAMAFGDEVKRGKPDPEPYLLAASKLGVDPKDCLVVEDTPSGARSALSAGMAVAVVPDVVSVPDDVAERVTVLNNITEISTLLSAK